MVMFSKSISILIHVLISFVMIIWCVYGSWKNGVFRRPEKYIESEEFNNVGESSDKKEIGFWLLFRGYGHPLIVLQDRQYKVMGTFERALCGKSDDKGRPLTWQKARKSWFASETNKILVFYSKEPDILPSFVMIYHCSFSEINYIEVFSYEDFKMIGRVSEGHVSGSDLSAGFCMNLDKLNNPVINVVDQNSNRLGFMEERTMEKHNKLIGFRCRTYRLVIQPWLSKEQKAVVIATLLFPLQQHLVEGYSGGS